MSAVRLVAKKTSTLHDFPYAGPGRKCPHFWIINVTAAGPNQCIHDCVYCYAREAVYSNPSPEMLVYDNLPEMVEHDLARMRLCPPIMISTVTDACQDVPELRAEVMRLVGTIVRHRLPFMITTKGDPSFLLEIPGFSDHALKALGITIEGTAEVLTLISPRAPAFADRLAAVSKMSAAGVDTLVRLDPLFPHLFQALYGERWFAEIEQMVRDFRAAGASHVIASTGRLSKKRRSGGQASGATSLASIRSIIARLSPLEAARFDREYEYTRAETSSGYLWRKDLRLAFHGRLKTVVEAGGMTYSTCQELTAAESDSVGIPHCERFLLPFCEKQPDGTFRPVGGCTADCHVTCQGLPVPPCGRPEMAVRGPFKPAHLRQVAASFDSQAPRLI